MSRSDATSNEQRLAELIRTNERVMRLLHAVKTLQLDEWCIAASTIRNLVWDFLHDHPTPTLPGDIDVLIYDDQRLDPAYERSIEQQLTQLIPDVQWEVVNQATIHTYTGDATPYTSITEAMERWADLVTAVAARLNDDDSVDIIAPGGLNDLFAMQVRPNYATPTSAEVYQHRMTTKGWQQRWPKLTIHGIETSHPSPDALPSEP